MELRKSRKDILSGLVFIGIGAAFAVGALGYPMGTATRMGAGYFPFALSLILVAFGVAILVKGFRNHGAAETLGTVPWRGGALILGAIVFFGFCLTGLGFVPTLFVTVFASALASRSMTALGALALALGMVVLCYVIFIKGLGVTVPLFGPWLPV
ncbi:MULTISPECIES: tripartite tricarboxylate transporter TctB family protein [unclassified Aureimonas]|uniref:tripartite tricarboxylate transporter TctB family protein n=1 Tax=unclassified Aureimonas TaxID=2615206 RepID=UPI0006FD01C6|nr:MULTISPECIES: tripartite tricarboxylate transporter TctB family protein [unclassified Aureimonas]KQT64471.1 hypothetical protein ASG62_05845 [Aureimonas sp. Leaf427]KQT81659.1 hypothetical protein ASG54_03125 [Aureimonas sp. Leaf460]